MKYLLLVLMLTGCVDTKESVSMKACVICVEAGTAVETKAEKVE